MEPTAAGLSVARSQICVPVSAVRSVTLLAGVPTLLFLFILGIAHGARANQGPLTPFRHLVLQLQQ